MFHTRINSFQNKKSNSGIMNNESFQDADEANDGRGGWVKGVGEGRNDEDNLSAYFRFCK